MASNGKSPGSVPPDPERGSLTPEERDALRRRAAELGRRLDEVHARRAPPPGDPRVRGNALGMAFKILTELVVGVVVGGGMGWALDRWLGTAPWLLILFLLLGFAAGMSNVVRTARKMQAQVEPLQRSAPSVPDEDGDERRPRDIDPGPRR
jgi:ATP synthase protein I